MAEKQMRPGPQISPPVPENEPKVANAEETKQELQQAIQGSNEILAQATTVLMLFPDTIAVDRAKITVTKRTFFRTAEITSIRIEDVLNVACAVRPVFTDITLVSQVMNNDQTNMIGRFWRHDAERFKRIAQGM